MKQFVLLFLALIAIAFASKVTEDVLNTLSLKERANIAIEMRQQVNFKEFGFSRMNVHHDIKAQMIVDALRATAEYSQQPIINLLKKENVEFSNYWITNIIFVRSATKDLIMKLASRSDVAQISSNEEFDEGIETPNEIIQNIQKNGIEWNVKWVNADKVWEQGYKGKGMVVGGIDTGIHSTHPAIAGSYRGNVSNKIEHDYNWWDGVRNRHGGKCGYRSKEPCDDNGHGTHTIGTAAGGFENKWIGVAPEAKWIGCRNMASGRNSLERTTSCCQFMMAPTDLEGNNPDPKLRPHSTVNSYRCSACSRDSMKQIFEAMKEAGIVMSVAAGNSGSRCSTVTQPGYLDSVLTVAATNKNSDTIARFSGRGPISHDGNRRKPDISAPGVSVLSAIPPNRYASYSGTSMATPNIAGVIALLWNAVPSLERDLDKTYQVLFETAKHQETNECNSNGSPNNVYGYGTVDVKKAVDYARMKYGN